MYCSQFLILLNIKQYKQCKSDLQDAKEESGTKTMQSLKKSLLSIQITDFQLLKKSNQLTNKNRPKRLVSDIICHYRRVEELLKCMEKNYAKESQKSGNTVNRIQKKQFPQSTLSAKTWALYDIKKGKSLGSQTLIQREIASLTKVMTCLVVLETLAQYQIPKTARIKVTKLAASMPGTNAQLKPDYWITIQDLLYGMMLPSGNDAATLLAQALGLLIYYFRIQSQLHSVDCSPYSQIESVDLSSYQDTSHFISEFVRKMNKKASALRMKNTHFCNVTGLAATANYSCAADLVTLGLECIKNAQFMKIVSHSQYTAKVSIQQHLKDEKHEEIQWKNTNILVGKGWSGIKTGMTKTAGSCLMSLRDHLLIIVLGCPTPQKRFEDTEKLFEEYQS